MARAGLRLGEALALQWEDLHFHRHEIRVARGFSRGRLDTPKSRHGRTVDMSEQLARNLLRLQIERKTETLRRGWAAVPPWVFCTKRGTPLDITNADKAFKRILKRAELALHFTPHCLRHTFASLLLQQGESPAGLRTAPARPREHSAHGRYVWPLASDGQQGRRRSPRRRGSGSKW